MGVDTRGYIPGISRDDLKNFLSHISNLKSLENTHSEDYKIINLTYKDEQRNLNVFDTNLMRKDAEIEAKNKGWSIEDTSYWQYVYDDGLPNNTEGFLLSLRMWGSSILIMKMICFRFGGYLDESDSDEEGYYKIDKDFKQIIKLIFT